MKTRYLQITLTVLGLIFAAAPMRLMGHSVFVDLKTYPSTLAPLDDLVDILTIDVLSNNVTGNTDVYLNWGIETGPSPHWDSEVISVTNSAARSGQQVSIIGPGYTAAQLTNALHLPPDWFIHTPNSLLFHLDLPVITACVTKITMFNQNTGAHTAVGCTELLASILSEIGFVLPIIQSDETPYDLNQLLQDGIFGKGLLFRDGTEIKSFNTEYRQGLPTQMLTNLPSRYTYMGHLDGGQPTGIGRAMFAKFKMPMVTETYIGPLTALKSTAMEQCMGCFRLSRVTSSDISRTVRRR